MLNPETTDHMNVVVKTFGHAIVFLYTTTGISYAHTVGLTDLNLPEIIVFSLAEEETAHILNKAARLLKQGKLPLGTPIKNIYINPLMFKTIKAYPNLEFIQLANMFALKPVRLIQMFWADDKARFPWEKNYNLAAQPQQPILWQGYN